MLKQKIPPSSRTKRTIDLGPYTISHGLNIPASMWTTSFVEGDTPTTESYPGQRQVERAARSLTNRTPFPHGGTTGCNKSTWTPSTRRTMRTTTSIILVLDYLINMNLEMQMLMEMEMCPPLLAGAPGIGSMIARKDQGLAREPLQGQEARLFIMRTTKKINTHTHLRGDQDLRLAQQQRRPEELRPQRRCLHMRSCR